MFDVTLSHPALALPRAQALENDLLREAEIRRLLKRIESDRFGLRETLLLGVGQRLVSLRLWLKARYQPNSTVPTFQMGQ